MEYSRRPRLIYTLGSILHDEFIKPGAQLTLNLVYQLRRFLCPEFEAMYLQEVTKEKLTIKEYKTESLRKA